MKTVGVVLVNYNGFEDTVACVQSLDQLTEPRLRIYIVDNGSSPSQAAQLQSACPGAFVLDAEKNGGFAAGNNVGVNAALADQVDYVMLLNNDTEVLQPDAIARLVRLAESHPGAIVGPKVVYHDDPSSVWFVGGVIDLKNGTADHVEVGAPTSQFSGIRETDFVTGCALLASREIFERVGLLEESYFLYFEDVDWNLKAKAAGARCWLDLDAVVTHKVSQSIRKAGALEFYYLFRNRLAFGKRWAPRGPYLTHVIPHTLWRAGYIIGHDVLHRDWPRAKFVARAMTDHFRGRTGRM